MPVATPGASFLAPFAQPDNSKSGVCTCLNTQASTNDNVISHAPVARAVPFVRKSVSGPGVIMQRWHIEFAVHSHLANHARVGAAYATFVQTSGRSMLLSLTDVEISWVFEA